MAEAVNPESLDDDRRVAMRFESSPLAIPAGDTADLPLAVFLGPKKRSLLENDYYGGAGVAFNQTLVSPFGCTFCVFQPVVDALVFLLSVFHFLTQDWGLAIIGLVILVRTLLHPITRRSQRNLMKMSKLAPKIQAAKEKYGDDRQKMAQAMAEIAPEQTQALLFGCLPMLLQTPIWIALYSTLQATIELRGAPLLYGWTWIDDLSKPDHLIEFGSPIPLLFGISLTGINLLPILMGVVFYIQMKLQPQPTATMSDEQKQQQKIIQVVMVGLFPIFLYIAPSGLNLYILTSTTVGIFESRAIRANLKREEEAEEAQRLDDERLGIKREPKEPTSRFGKKMKAFRETIATRVADAQKMQADMEKAKGKRK